MSGSLDKSLFSEFPPISTEEWENIIIKDLKGADYEKRLVWKTDNDFSLQPYYRREDLKNLSYLESLPGEVPFVRGKNRLKNDWDTCQDISHSSAEDANRFALGALKGEVEALCFITDVSSDTVSGISLQSQKDMETLLKGIFIENVSLHFEAGKASVAIFAMYVNEAKKRGLELSRLRGSSGYDPLQGLSREGTAGIGLNEIWNRTSSELSGMIEALPSFHNLVVHASDYHNAGAGTAAELGISLAHGAEYLAGLQSSGMDVGAVAKTLQFSFSVSASYFVEIAKFRAFRLLWANILSAYGIKGALPVFIQARTSEWNKTLYDPHVNILRGTTEAMSAAIAGCDSISVSHFDSVYSHGDEFSLRIARNTQHLLKHESYLNRVKDPSAGSYYIENLTDKLAESAWKVFQDIETKGGFIAALKEGYIQSLLQSFKAERAKNVASRKEILLGTNQYPILKEESLSRLEKISKPLSLKTSGKAVSTESIQKLSEALESGALLGDILQSSFKKTEEGIQPVTVFRASEAFEAIRLATEKYGKQKGASPSVFLAGFGNLAMRIARATFSSNFFACAGYRILDNPAFNQASDIAEAYLKSGAEILVLCSSDEEYGEMGVSVAKLVKEKKPSAQLIIAGNPAALIDSLKGAGVDDFIHVRTDVLGFLTQMQNKLGIKVGE